MRKFKGEDISITIGFLLVAGSIGASVISAYYYWYSFYVVGAFMLFGGLNHKLNSKSVYSYILNKKWKRFLIIYVFGVLTGCFVDIVYGRNIANLWHYPHLGRLGNYLFPILLYYPFGGLQVYEVFYLCQSLLSKKLGTGQRYKLSNKLKNLIMNLLIVFLGFGLIIPILNLIFNSNKFANKLIVSFMILTIFSFDALVYKVNKKSILLDFIQGNKLTIGTMCLSWLISVILTEVPNTFSWEWIYYNVPFVKMQFCKINLLIFTFGWFFLVYVPVRGVDFVRLLLKEVN